MAAWFAGESGTRTQATSLTPCLTSHPRRHTVASSTNLSIQAREGITARDDPQSFTSLEVSMSRSALPLRIVVLVWVIAPATAASQESLPRLDDYHVRVFTVANGLPSSDVTAIAQPADGYLYVATGRGLVRFDGQELEPVPLDGFSTRTLQYLWDDGMRLWVVSRGNDLGYIEDGRLEVLRSPPGEVRSIATISDGSIWLGTDVGLVRVRTGTDSAYTVFDESDGLPNRSVAGVIQLVDGEVLVITLRDLVRMEPRTNSERAPVFTTIRSGIRLRSTARRSALFADSGGLWLALDDGVGRYRDGRYTRIPSPLAERTLPLDSLVFRGPGDAVGVHLALKTRLEDGASDLPQPGGWIMESSDGDRWITGRGPTEASSLIRQHDGRSQVVNLEDHLTFRDINGLLEDHEGSIWVATDRGLVQLSRQRAAALTARHGLAEGFTTAILQTRDGAVWVGTWGGGLYRFADGALDRRYTKADGLPDSRIRSLFESSNGTLWIGTLRGFAAIGEAAPSPTRPFEEVRSFAETTGPDGLTLWVGRGNRLLVGHADGAGSARTFTEFRRGFEWGSDIWVLHAARDGAVWVGGRGGLFRVAGDTIRRFGAEDGLLGNLVVSIHEDRDGTLWFGTYEHGLHRYRGGRLVPVTVREGLHHDGVWAMMEDDAGGVWMSSDGGIFRVDRARLEAIADGLEEGQRPRTRLEPLVFTESDGLPSRESNRASPAAWRLTDGRLVFNSIAGLTIIDPERAVRSPPPPRTVLRTVLVDGEPMPLRGGEARTPAGPKQLAFEFAALSFVSPGQQRFRYRLDGFDAGWAYSGTARRVSYTRLAPGRYTFRVQAATGSGPWSEEDASWAFTVPARFWQTWWFRVLALVTAAALMAVAYRVRVARLLEIERLRLRIASDLHDGVGSNLSSIALLSEMLQQRTRTDGLERRQLERISRAAGETIGALREIIWLVDPEHDNVADLVARMRATAADLLAGIDLHFDAAEPVVHRRLGPLFVRHSFLLYKEALHNVAKHARASRVRIVVRADANEFRFRIEDDGAGYREAEVEGGHGLNSMRRRADACGGELTIESARGSGTRLTFRARMA